MSELGKLSLAAAAEAAKGSADSRLLKFCQLE